MNRAREGSTRRLIELSLGYFLSYILTGILVKYFTGGLRDPRMSEMAYLFNNTLGGSLLALSVVFAFGWIRMKSNRWIRWGPLRLPSEISYIIPSGACTAVVILTTTLMYTLPISVMVAMVIMRGSIIVISRAVDAVQIRQGILKRKVFAEENWAVVFALLAVGINVALVPLVHALEARGVPAARAVGLSERDLLGSFDFLHNVAAMTIMGLYIVAYSFRIYIMNYFKNTRAAGVKLDNKGFFAFEQIAASLTMVLAGLFFFLLAGRPGQADQRLLDLRGAVLAPDLPAILSGIPYGLVAFFSVFIFMFKGRTATFAGLVNRLVSLLAGTAATLLLFVFFKTSPPKPQDWASLLFILVAVYFLTRAEKLRSAELAAGESGPGGTPGG